jgi:pimeloyl-ACP methyl ester carboxylesterase
VFRTDTPTRAGLLYTVLACMMTSGLTASTRADTDGVQAIPARIESEGATLAGTWLFPDTTTRVPCVIIAGGTMSHTRDGAMFGGGDAGRSRDALRRWANRFASAGYALLRWDKRGFGESPQGDRPIDDALETTDLIAAIDTARQHPRVSSVIVAGESAGGYFACLAAKQGTHADGYIFLAALASPVDKLFEHNYVRFAQWAAERDANRTWAETHALWALARGEANAAMFAAARRGEPKFTITYGDHTFPYDTRRVRYQLANPPGDLFRSIERPTLILQGETDMNVPPGDAQRIAETIRAAGNAAVEVATIPNADHSFQFADSDPDQRIRDRHAFASFYKPYAVATYYRAIAWLNKHFPTEGPQHPVARVPRSGIAHWEGIQVIDDVTDALKNPGIDTLEGRIGPLMHADGGRAHYIDMPAGLFVSEHGHSSESLIYTVRGQWVLCSGGVRRLMNPKSLYWFRAGTPTGYEVPFDEDAYILILKTAPADDADADSRFWSYLTNMQTVWPREQKAGREFSFTELPPDHPARVYAREVNPAWERKLPQSEDLPRATHPHTHPHPH